MQSSTGNQQGITLVELLISLVMIGLITTAAYSFYLNQHKQWIVQEQISDMQQNARVSMDELVKKLRMAGYVDLPQGIGGAIVAADANPDTISIRFNSRDCAAPIGMQMPQPSMPLHFNEIQGCFEESTWVFVCVPETDPLYPYGEWFFITSISVNQGEGWEELLHGLGPLSISYPAGSFVLQLEEYKYYIDQTTDPSHPKLMRQMNGQTPEVFAEDIEDLQFVYTLADGSTTSSPANPDDIRVVAVRITARTERQDPDYPGDHYRRRVFSSRVQVRNLSL
jgi:prepilin-type N-terminal cleavage/methylation domain-containing protein